MRVLLKARCVASLLGVFLIGQSEAASREEIVTSIHSGGAPYLISFEDAQGTSTMEPGLYVRGEDGHWKLAFSGSISPAPLRGGLHLQLSLGRVTGRSESIGIIDNKILLFSSLSRSDQSDSYVLLSSAGSSLKLKEPLTNQTAQIPLVENPRDVSFFETTVEKGGSQLQVVIISLKHHSALGTGLTFAFVLKAADNEGGAMRLAYDPVLLDWNYLNQAQVASRFISRPHQSFGFVSQIVLDALSNQRPEDSIELTKWRRQLSRVAQGQISPLEFEDQVSQKSFPYLNVEDGSLDMVETPAIRVDLAKRESLVAWDPVSGRSFVFSEKGALSLRALKLTKPFAVLKPQFTESGYLSTSDLELHFPASLLRAEDDWPHLIMQVKTQNRSLLLGTKLLPTDPRYLDDRLLAVEAHTIADRNWIFVSWKFERGELTSLYEVEATTQTIAITQQMTLSDQFFTSAEMRRRTKSYGETRSFDELTPRTATETEYIEKHRLTAPHIDLVRSLEKRSDGREIRHYFPMPLEKSEVTYRFEFRRFEASEGIESRTGIYIKEADAHHSPLIRGEVVAVQFANGKPFLTEQALPAEYLSDSLIAVLVDDRGEKVADRGNIWLLAASRNGEPPRVQKLSNVRFESNAISSFGFIQVGESQKKATRLNFVTYVTLKTGVTHLFGVVIDASEKHQTLKVNWGREIMTEFSQEEIVNRLRVDARGDAYWVIHPEMDDSEPRATLWRLYDDRNIQARGLKLWRIKDQEGISNSSVAYGSWRLSAGDESDRQRMEKLRGASEYQLDAFDDYKQILETMADPQKPARHLILVVPDELEKYAEEYPMALRVRESERPEFWSALNNKLKLFNLRGGAETTQDEVLLNLDSLREATSSSRPVLFSTLKAIKSVGRPKLELSTAEGRQRAFQLSFRQLKEVAFQEVKEAGEQNAPHLMYLLATEGKRTPVTEFKPKALAPIVPMILVGTRRQLQELVSEAELEDSFGLFQSFDVHYLEPPTTDKRIDFMLKLLRRPELRMFNYQIDLDGLLQPGETAADVPPSEAEARLAEYLVNRSEILSRSNRFGIFESFMRVMNMLGTELTTNPLLRRERRLSKGTAERVLARVFPMQLNVELLPANDPLRVLLRRDAPLLVQQAGYHAPLPFIQRGIRTILNQLTPDDIKKRNSLMIFGETGSGKTEYVKALLFKALKLKAYDFRRPVEDNFDAWVFFVEGKKVFETDRRTQAHHNDKIEVEDGYSVAEIDAHLDRFLISQNGSRGFIVFDDIHLLPPKARTHFLSRIRSLQDNPTVMIRIGDKRYDFPTRNITPIITFNLTDNQKRIESFAGKNNTNPSQDEIVLATLSAPDGSDDLDKSFLARWGATINLSVGAPQTKEPKLLATAKASAQTTFSNYRRLVFVSGESVTEVTEAFPKYDFRTLVSPAAAAMVSLPNREGPGIYIVVPRRSISRDEALKQVTVGGRFSSSSEQDGSDVEVYVSKRLKAIKVDGDYMARIEFLRYLTGNFRRRAFDWLVKSAASDPRFAETTMRQQLLLAPLSHAVRRHLTIYPEPYLSEIVVDEVSIGAKTELEKKNFSDAWRRMIETENPNQTPLLGVNTDFGNFVDGPLSLIERSNERGREKIIAETANELTAKLGDILAESLHINNWREPPTPLEWIRSMPQGDLNPGHPALKALSDVLHRYFEKMMNERGGQDSFVNSSDLDSYTAMRLFMTAFDRALYRLHWGKVTGFLIEGLQIAVGDLSKGQSPAVQHFIFESRTSPLSSLDLGLVLSNAKYQPFVEETEAAEAARNEKYMAQCSSILKGLAP